VSLRITPQWAAISNDTLPRAASEALYVTGDFSLLTALVDDPLMKARSFEDKLNILNNLVRALAGKIVRN